MQAFSDIINELKAVSSSDMFNEDFLLTREKSVNGLKSVLLVADALRYLRENSYSPRIFDSGLGVSVFRDNSTRTRFSFASACNLLGLLPTDLDEGKSQIAHGETVRETAVMVSFMADAIGIRDDMYIGKGNAYMREVKEALDKGCESGVLKQRPTLVNLQCDIDHPTQTMADLAHLKQCFGSLENLKGKKLAMTWAYSPSYGKPLSVPQGIIELMTRMGMNVTLAYPKGYDVLSESAGIAAKNAEQSGGSFTITHDMKEAFSAADIVYPKSWAPFDAMKERSRLYEASNFGAIEELEKHLLQKNAQHKDWVCDESLMKLTENESALYMHCLPADISAVSCAEGEVTKGVFETYRDRLYMQASYKPYIIAAMIFLAKVKEPAERLLSFSQSPGRRCTF